MPAAGGYWISMDGETIFTSPFCITGSIGVIGGWAWNDGLGEKLGLTSDRVQKGTSADLLGGLVLPYLGLTVPERNLTETERARVKELIHQMYDRFTDKVASGREMEIERVRELAQGRVYLGRRALELDLVDGIGTLEDTIDAARRAAGIADGRLFEIEEYPPRPLFRLPRIFRTVASTVLGEAFPEVKSSRAITYQTLAVEQILRQPGRPLVLTPGSLLPAENMVAH